MDDSNDNPGAPAARRSVHRYLSDDDPNFSIRDPEPDDPLANDPGFKQRRAVDQNRDPADDPVLVKYAGIGALADAGEQIGNLDKDVRAKLRYELIDQHVSMAMKDGCSRNDAIDYAMKRFGVSARTVETALDYMQQERERTPGLLTMPPEAEAKAKAFEANEAEIKAKAKQRFLRWRARLALWLKFKDRPALWLKLTATKRDSPQ
jgi:hypothetical protein